MEHVVLQCPPELGYTSIVVPGEVRYAVKDNGIVEVHRSHEAHMRALGFRAPKVEPAVEVGKDLPPAKSEAAPAAASNSAKPAVK